jgi:hypothetical protein
MLPTKGVLYFLIEQAVYTTSEILNWNFLLVGLMKTEQKTEQNF